MSKVRWAELRPDAFRERQDACPIVWLPVGLCEPHGHVAALGLDTHIADAFCDEGARRYGGIVAPTQGYHIHESGGHAAWLEEMVGEHSGYMAALPPWVFCYQFLYQLRAFANAGFKAALVITGHGGGNELDLQTWAAAFTARFGLPVRVMLETEVVPSYPSDHAGKYELSALWHLRPEWVDMALLNRQHEPNSGGRLALGHNAGEASPEYGAAIVAEAMKNMQSVVEALKAEANQAHVAQPIPYDPVEKLYAELKQGMQNWVTMKPGVGQRAVPVGSRWKPYEKPQALS
jgi:creatinine amidohydrolase